MIKVATVCSGIGSPEQALKTLGIDHEVVFSCEIDKYARMTYQANHQTNMMYEDITKLDYENLPDHNILIGGFPCQSWSLAGKRQGFEDEKGRGGIFFNILEILKAKKPDVFILENVKGLLSHDQGESFKAILDTLSASINGQFLMFPYFDTLGYDVYWQVLNATDYGTPQNRERVFIIGFKKPVNYVFPKKQPLKLKLIDLLEDNPDSKYFLSQKAVDGLINHKDHHKAKGNGFGASIVDKQEVSSRTISARYYKDGSECLIKDLAKYNLSEKALSRIETKNYSDPKFLPEITGTINTQNNSSKLSFDSDTTLIPNPLDKFLKDSQKNSQGYRVSKPDISVTSDSNAGGMGAKTGLYAIPVLTPERPEKRQNGRRFKEDGEPMFTLTAQDKHGIYNGVNIRRLTPLECFRLFGFPDNFIKPVSETQQYKQAGNSIVVNVMEAIFKSIFKVWNK